MKKYYFSVIVLLLGVLLITGCGGKKEEKKEKEKTYDDIVADVLKTEGNIESVDNYFNGKEMKLLNDKINGRLNTAYYDFDKDGSVEFLISRVKDNSIELTLYDVVDGELKYSDSVTIFEDFLDFNDIIDLNAFVKIIDDEPFIFGEAVGYTNLTGDGIRWNFVKIGFSNGKFWDVAKDGVNGSYFDDDYLKEKKDFVRGTGLEVTAFSFFEDGKSLYEQNKENACELFRIERKHIDGFDDYGSRETKVKYGSTTFNDMMENGSDVKAYLK